jgi:hypothetical protein
MSAAASIKTCSPLKAPSPSPAAASLPDLPRLRPGARAGEGAARDPAAGAAVARQHRRAQAGGVPRGTGRWVQEGGKSDEGRRWRELHVARPNGLTLPPLSHRRRRRQVVLTGRHLGIVMTFEPGGDLHVFCNKFKIDEVTVGVTGRNAVEAVWRGAMGVKASLTRPFCHLDTDPVHCPLLTARRPTESRRSTNHTTTPQVAARYFFIQIISALDYCHRHRICHRDLKLSNFMLTGNVSHRLLAFGII